MEKKTKKILIGVAVLILVVIFYVASRDPLASYVKADAIWTPNHFNEMLNHCDASRLTALEKSLNLEPGGGAFYKRVVRIKKDFIWESSHITEYLFKNVELVEYHKTVQWLAKKHGIAKDVREQESTFILERLIFEQIFHNLWEELTIQQRSELLKKIDTDGKLDIETLALMGGTTALATLATTVYFTGFAFYTTMTTVMYTVAGFLGATLPFGVYTAATTTIAFLSGPVGWAVICIGATGTLAHLGRADMRETTAFIIQVHSLKVVALQNNGMDIPQPSR